MKVKRAVLNIVKQGGGPMPEGIGNSLNYLQYQLPQPFTVGNEENIQLLTESV